MSSQRITTALTYGVLSLAGVISLSLPKSLVPSSAASGHGSAYEFEFQNQVGALATFNVTGPATGNRPDVQGDAILTTVEYASGDKFIKYYKPANVSDLQYSGNTSRLRVRGGTKSTIGLNCIYPLSSQDPESFKDLMLTAFNNNNLNNYLDSSGGITFSFIIEFELVVKDNDEGPDELGEILYFERGTGNGNSWLKIQAVDENGAPLGPWLVIGPSETVQTTPRTTVMRRDQKVGTTAIDVSRLGVSEFQYLRVSNNLNGEPAYTGGGDTNPDFKIMAVMTNQAQLGAVLNYD